MDSRSEASEATDESDDLSTAGLREADLQVPNAARMYDYYLGGHHNLAIDREAADRAISLYADFPLLMAVGRAFLRRAVRFLAHQGIERFLDIGSGIPTVGNVHRVAQQANPAARVVYVDIDPVAVAYSGALLEDEPNATIIEADLLDTERILNHAAVRDLLAPGEPVALILAYVLHFVLDNEQAVSAVRRLWQQLPRGSYVAISHGSMEGFPPEIASQLVRLYKNTSQPVRVRTRAEIERFFEDLELLEPGVVLLPLWHPEDPNDLMLDHPERSSAYAGVARKPW